MNLPLERYSLSAIANSTASKMSQWVKDGDVAELEKRVEELRKEVEEHRRSKNYYRRSRGFSY